MSLVLWRRNGTENNKLLLLSLLWHRRYCMSQFTYLGAGSGCDAGKVVEVEIRPVGVFLPGLNEESLGHVGRFQPLLVVLAVDVLVLYIKLLQPEHQGGERKKQFGIPCIVSLIPYRTTRSSIRQLYFCCLGKTQPNWNRSQNELPSDERRELYHFLLRCFDAQIGKNTKASQRNISFMKHWVLILFMDYDNEHKLDDWDDGWVLDSE